MATRRSPDSSRGDLLRRTIAQVVDAVHMGGNVLTDAPEPPKRSTYRHGDLRRALIEAGLELARVGGPDAVILREATRRAGVVPNAAYRHFEDRHRTIIREYYSTEYRSGHCPPGLAKKNNGCMPPGQAKKWHVGHPLPRDVIYYELPPAVVVRIGAPPAGHRYVRVAADILLIAIGTGMVIDAAFAGAPAATFAVRGAEMARDSAVLGLGVSARAGDKLTLFAGYDVRLNADATSHAVTAGLRASW